MVKPYKPYIAVTPQDRAIYESFKGEVEDTQIKFPKALGAEHPFDFKELEEIYENIGLISSGVNKMTRAIIGDFTVKVKNPNAQAILDDFNKNSNFKINLNDWVREAILKGNGFMEIDLKENKVRVNNANSMYVKRNNKSKVLFYNQYCGLTKNFARNLNKVIQFSPDQIAHLRFNKIPNKPYGIGEVKPNLVTIQNIARSEVDAHKLVTRKAGAPMHVKVGQPGMSVQQKSIDDFKALLQYMTNRTEWVTDPNIEITWLDFKDLGKNLTAMSDHDFKTLVAGMEIPEVLWGSGQLNEGIADTQLEGWDRKIGTMREEVEAVIIDKIYGPLLKNQKNKQFDVEIEFEWELQGEKDKNAKLTEINKQLSSPLTSPELRASLEKEYATIMGLEDVIDLLPTPQEARKRADEEQKAQMDMQTKALDNKGPNSPEGKKEKKIKQPEVPGAKKVKQVREKTQSEIDEELIIEDKRRKESGEMNLQEFINIQEIKGFNYSDYLVKILQRLRVDKFTDLLALTDQAIADGLLPKREIEKLRFILKDGFRKNKSMLQIENDIRETIPLKDRLKDKKLIVTAKNRPSLIARTETVRLANEGLRDLYKDNGVKEVSFLSALSDRTCPECSALDGEVFPLSESQGVIPVHPNCRCSWIAVI